MFLHIAPTSSPVLVMSSRSRHDVVTKVYVGGLTEDIGNDQLQEEFERFGPVKTVWVARNPSSKGYAFVDYYSVDHALEAVREMDGRFCFGSQIKVEISKNELDKNDKSLKRPSGDRKDRHDRHRRRHRSQSPRNEEYLFPHSPRRRSGDRSPISDDRHSRSPDRRSQSPDQSAANETSSESQLLPDFVLRNAITLILLRDPLLLRAASAMGGNGIKTKAENTERRSFGSGPRPRDRKEQPKITNDLLDILTSSQALDFNENLKQHTALQNFMPDPSAFGFMNRSTQNLSLPANPNLSAMLPNQQPFFTNGNQLQKSTSSSAPCDMTNDWHLNPYYGYTPMIPSAPTAMATADKTSVSTHPTSQQQQTTPVFPVRMPFPRTVPQPPRMPPRR